MVLRFGAVDRAETKDEAVVSGANLNLMFTHSWYPTALILRANIHRKKAYERLPR